MPAPQTAKALSPEDETLVLRTRIAELEKQCQEHERYRGIEATMDGSHTGAISPGHDISSGKQVESQLRQSEERLRFALDCADMLVWDWVPETDEITYVGEVSENLRAAGLADFLGRIHPDDRDQVGDRIRRCIENSEPYRAEYRFQLPDGTILWERDAGHARIGEDGRLHMAGVASNITELRQTEQSLEEQRRLTESIIESAPTLTYILNLQDGRNVFASSQAQDILGYSPEEIRDMGPDVLPRLLHPDDVGAVNARFQVILNSAVHDIFEVEYRMKRKNGDYVWLFSRDRILKRDPQGTPLQILGIALDITERKRVEEALRRSNRELESFAGTVSHDLREPLRTVTAYSQLLVSMCKDSLDPRADQLIAQISLGTARMQRLIDDLLAFATSTAARPHQEDAADSGAALGEALANLSLAINESGAVITWTPLPVVICERFGLVQTFQNLLSNALRYRGHEVQTEINISAQLEGEQWVFEVRDNGPGIPLESQKRIFDLFTRLHSRNISGSGIGLATVKRIVERNGGRVWVHSIPDAGSSFFFSLPMVRQVH